MSAPANGETGWYRAATPRPCFWVAVLSECERNVSSFIEQLNDLQAETTAAIGRADSTDALAEVDREILGGKGKLTLLMRQLGGLGAEERPAAGRESNRVKQELTGLLDERKEALRSVELTAQLESETLDVTLPGRKPQMGVIHPVFQMIEELSDIFALMGFQTVFGREVESGYYNFDQLNIPSDHPARDVWDTFLVESDGAEIVLRTHTSPMQARVMEQTAPPVRVVVPGRTYRYEAQDASHEWMFHQLEGLAVDEHITLADLKGVLQELARQLFGPKRKIRFRCDFFPFVEPGVDFAVDCAICDGAGCRVCKHSGWLEMGGAGMVHRKVLEAVGYDADKYSGFAFGLGIERMVMMRHGVDDVRAFAGNDLRFLQQFAAKAVGIGGVTA
jgi:phenylalanyl-tRNA synthetase alpha chain